VLKKSQKDGDFQLTKNFQGIPDQGYYIPPDPYLAVGPNHIIATVNSRFRILDKSGVVQKTIEANTWYNTTMSNSDPFDPKVIYDHFANRWVMVWLSVQTSTSYFMISVSDDSDPNGVWFNWKLPQTQTVIQAQETGQIIKVLGLIRMQFILHQINLHLPVRSVIQKLE
jgi:hypothetical protein